jgi:magnesium transporter
MQKQKLSTEKSNPKVVDYLLTNIPIVSFATTVGEALAVIRKKKNWDTISYIYIIDDKKSLVGVVSIKELLKTKDSVSLKSLARKDPVGVNASSPQERVAVAAIYNNIKVMPVFKPGTREMLGVVGTDDILKILHNEHVEDYLRFSGITQDHPTVDIFKAGVWRLVKLRLSWLLVGLVVMMVGAVLIGNFSHTLEKEIATAFFIPIVVYMSNAVGIQAQALLIRLLAQQKVKQFVFIRKEVSVSFILAFISGLITTIFALVWLGSVEVALTVGLAIFASTVAAVFIGVSIPFLLYKMKKDPALGSGPFATSLQDIVSIMIYFLIATIILF